MERVVLADRPYSDRRVDFKSEEDFLAFWPDELIPVEQAIEIITHYYRRTMFPKGTRWKEWDAKAMEWQTKSEADASGGVVAPAVSSGPDVQPTSPVQEP